MIYCLNPTCVLPENPDGTNFCMSCGTKLSPLLRGRYSIIRAIGQEGFSKTYLAVDRDWRNAWCAVKQFSPSPALQNSPPVLEKAREFFNLEAEKLLHLEEHPQIPTLFAYFEENNRLYLVQQFIKGHTLLEELQQEGTFSEPKIRKVLGDLLPVLQFVHDRKVTHRNIKPESIIRRQSDGKLVLADFGVAKQWAGTLLSRQRAVPRRIRAVGQMRGVAHPASDLYSLAVTCIRLMTGCFPKADGADELFDAMESCWRWREKLPAGTSVSPELEQVLDKLLSDYFKDRYQSAAEVMAALAPSTPTPIAQRGSGSAKGLLLSSFAFEMVTVDARGREINRSRRGAEYFPENLGGGIILEMVSIPGGTFTMGSPKTEEGRFDSESPQHSVTVEPFFMGKYAITQAQWKAVALLPKVSGDLNPDPSYIKGANRPVEYVSWNDAVEFCARLSEQTGRNYRLPSEAEWEYACRAGTTTPFHFGETITSDLANYDGNYTYASGRKGKYRKRTTDVGSFPPNAFGLYDTHGNVWEWCADPWHDDYTGAPSDGSVWEAGGNKNRRLLRGGSWYYFPRRCRAAFRCWFVPDFRYGIFGFRVALSLPRNQ
ncbi:bifunctional serine/threonine-protein kinase/formylglycine-generating enzyme family protein [Kamptonema formosum]|uniref:bifunctional serine/threonine-protein kinase/formylglycine-generating enzyme family protein n=1 Tax=Kamptonema formosum TaxID=331992 RepID=UPI00034C6CF1|nr:bifunctional serine/threonine-protein kinase/formylglycine-generating enzyme family protein [Oscillatoria sp. PCC 10802]